MTLEVAVHHGQEGFTLDATFSAGPGVTALFGPSGAGKSTLASLVAGLTRPRQGRIALDGRVLVDTATRAFVPQRKRRIGVVFQEGRLFPHLSVRQNLLFGRRFNDAANADPTQVIDLLGVSPLLDRRPRNLSGGEQQRVAIGRALLMDPRALIMDEPLAAIDVPRRAEILPYLERIRTELRIPILYISHSVEEVARLADTIVVLDAGRVVAAGPAAEVLGRLDVPALSGADQAAIVTAMVERHHSERGVTVLRHPAGPLTVPIFDSPIGATVRLRISARDVALAVGEVGLVSIRNRLPAIVAEVTTVGGKPAMVRIDLAGTTLLVRLTMDAVQDLALHPGSPVTALIKAVAVEGT